MKGGEKWKDFKSPKELVDWLLDFLENLFGKDYIAEQYRKLKSLAPKGKPEELKYLVEPNVHRVAKWYEILHNIKERNYLFDLRFSTDIEEFMKMLLFARAFDSLLKRGVVSLKDSAILGWLRDHRRGKFESFIHQVLVASNYAFHGFDVTFLDLLEEGKPDIYAKKGNINVYGECKRLVRNDKYVETAVGIGSWLFQEDVNVVLDITLSRTPKEKRDVEKIVKIAKKAVKENTAVENDDIHVYVQSLPDLLEQTLAIQVPSPQNIEFMLSTAYFGVFDGIPKIKNPKIIILRNPNKYDEICKRLRREFHKANKQLERVGRRRKVIYIDVSEIAGKPVIQLPELIRLDVGPELILGKVEEFIRGWLERHVNLDAVCLTQPNLYTDELGNPYTITWESRIISSYITPGWTVEMQIIPIPTNASPELLVNLGINLASKGLYKLAEFYYKKAIELNPNLKEAYNNLGNLLNETGRSHEALKYLDKALEIDSQYEAGLINKGIALANLGNFTQALEYFERTLNLDPNNEKAWYNKALVHTVLGQREDALTSVNKALAINPNYGLALQLKRQLESKGENTKEKEINGSL